MLRNLMWVGVLGSLFCATALADGNAPSPMVPSYFAKFFCVFSGGKKTGQICRAYGRFKAKKPDDIGRDPDDMDKQFMKIVCGDGDADSDEGQVIYNDGLEVKIHSDMDDYDNILDTDFVGTLLGTIRKIHVQDLNWNTLSGSYEASLIYGIPGQELTRLDGRCEFRREVPPPGN